MFVFLFEEYQTVFYRSRKCCSFVGLKVFGGFVLDVLRFDISSFASGGYSSFCSCLCLV